MEEGGYEKGMGRVGPVEIHHMRGMEMGCNNSVKAGVEVGLMTTLFACGNKGETAVE